MSPAINRLSGMRLMAAVRLHVRGAELTCGKTVIHNGKGVVKTCRIICNIGNIGRIKTN